MKEKLKILKMPGKPSLKEGLESLIKEANPETMQRKVKELLIIYVTDEDAVGRVVMPFNAYVQAVGALEATKQDIMRDWFEVDDERVSEND